MNRRQKTPIPERTTNIPIKSRMVSSIPQLKKGPAKINTKPIVNLGKKKTPTVQSTKEYPKILEELLWKTPIKEPIPDPVVAIDYVDMMNDLNTVCSVPAKYTESLIDDLQLKISDVKRKLNELSEKSQIQLDLQRAMLSYLKINYTQDTISELHCTNETLMLIMNEILVLNQQLQHLESQYTQQFTKHLVTIINDQKKKIKSQDFLIQDVFSKLKNLLIQKDTSHTSSTSTSSSHSSNATKTSCLSFSTNGTTSTDGSVESYEQELKDIIERLTKKLQEKQAYVNIQDLQRELHEIKATIFIDICKEPEIRETHEIKPSIHNYLHQLHETYITRESGYILQSASLELQLQKVMKEYDYLTRNLVDFKLERQKYQQEIKKLKLEKYHYLTELNDYKVIRLNESKLRKEFRELMKNVKENHKRDMLVELKKQRDLEQVIKEMKEDVEIKKWEMVDKSVQTNYPLV